MPPDTNTPQASIHASIQINAVVTGTVIANFAWQHLKAATVFRDKVCELEAANAGAPFGSFFNDIRTYGSACFMSSTSSLEALINEIFIAPNLGLRPLLNNFEKEFWGTGGIKREPILKKYQRALTLLGSELFDESAQPFRDVWALIELRNALIHYKPTWDPDRKRKVQMVEVLQGKFNLSPFLDEGADFVTMKCMSAGAVKWAVATSLAFMREFDTRTNLDSKKMQGFWKLETDSVVPTQVPVPQLAISKDL